MTFPPSVGSAFIQFLLSGSASKDSLVWFCGLMPVRALTRLQSRPNFISTQAGWLTEWKEEAQNFPGLLDSGSSSWLCDNCKERVPQCLRKLYYRLFSIHVSHIAVEKGEGRKEE